MATRTAAQVLDCLAGGKLVEGAVGEVLARPGPAMIAGAALLPSQAAVVAGRSVAGEGVVEGLQLRADASPSWSPSRSRSRCCVVQRAHRPGWMRPGCPQSGQLRQKPGSGRVQAEQSGSLRVPPRIGPV